MPAGSYTFTVSNASSVTMLTWLFDGTYETIKAKYAPNLTFDLPEDRIVGFNLYKSGGLTPSDEPTVQMELGSSATAYEPYRGETYEIAFPSEAGTVYGGSLDVTNGVLTMDRAMVDLETLEFTYDSKNNRFWVLNPIKSSFIANQTISDRFVYGNTASVNGTIQTTEYAIYLRDNRFTDSTEFKESLVGAQALFKLATPITYTLTPQEIRTLLGKNNIWADTGDTEVTYWDRKE